MCRSFRRRRPPCAASRSSRWPARGARPLPYGFSGATLSMPAGAKTRDSRGAALREGRIIRTRDRAPVQRGAVMHRYCVPSTNPVQQVQEAVRRFNLRSQLQPFRRCLVCGGALAPVSKERVRGSRPASPRGGTRACGARATQALLRENPPPPAPRRGRPDPGGNCDQRDRLRRRWGNSGSSFRIPNPWRR